MKIKLHAAAFILAFLSTLASKAQDFSNKGRDFWIAYTGHIDGTASVMGLYLTSDVNATGTVKVGNATLPFTIIANKVTTLFIGPNGGGAAPNTAVYNGQADGINSNAGIRVLSDKNIVVYAHIIRSARSGATLVLPTQVLGKDYIVPSYKNFGSQGANAGYGQITVVATEPNTTVEITTTVWDRGGGHSPNSPFIITLPNAGDVYQLQSIQNGDFSGSKVRSISTSGNSCKPISVFSSTTWSGFDCTNSSGGDNLYQQLFPTKSWGKKFVTAPFINKPYDIIRVFVQNASASVTKTEAGITSPLTVFDPVGKFYEIKTANPLVIEANEPVSVAQYITSQSCGGGNSDPEMTLINPVEQTLNNITLFSAHQNYVPTGQTQVTSHYINVVIPTSHKATFRIDGVLPSGTFVDIPVSGYSYLQENVTTSSFTNPVHDLRADTGFTAIVYGYGNVESYGYNAGTNVRDLYQFISVQNQFATVNFPASCRNTPFNFSMTFPYQPTQIVWQFNGLFADVTINNPVYDSTWFVNGKQLFRYKLPNPYTIATAGIYPIKVVAQNPTADGCGNTQEIPFDLQVFNNPTADFNFTSNGCISDSVRFTDNANTGGRAIIKYSWDFGDGGTAAIRNPAHLYNSAGPHTAKYSVITDVGCVSDTAQKIVALSPPPIAKFGTSLPGCIGRTITFTDSSTSALSTIAKWYWNFGDGSPQVVATTNAAQTHIYNTAGTYNVTLKVETASGCQSLLFSKAVIINVIPVAAFNFGGACLPSGLTQFTNTSTISDGTQSQFTYLWNFGDGNTSTQQSPTHTYASAGPFNVTLTVTSGSGCVDDTLRVMNSVYAQPDAAFTVNTLEPCLGSNITFTDQSTAASNTVASWAWNFGDGTTSTLQNPTKLYSTAGTYNVTLTITSAAGCVSDIEQKIITVLPLPLANFTTSALRCAAQNIQFTSTSVANAGAVTNHLWYVNGVLSGTTGSVFSYTPPSAGVYAIRLSISTDKGCTDDTIMSITVNQKPLASFATPNICLPAGTAPFNNLTTISDGTQSQITYQWNFGDGNTSTLVNPVHTYSGTGPYNVVLTATSNNGCTDDTIIVLNTIYAQPQAAFNAPAEVCLGATVNFTDQSSAANSTITQWQWNFGDGNTSVQQNPTHNYAASGTYTVTLNTTSAVGCPSNTFTKNIVINPLPQAGFNFSAPNCVTRDITFTNTSTAGAGNINKWKWDMGDGASFTKTTGAPFTHNYSSTGTYIVTLQVETDKGCISTVLSKQVVVSALPVPAFGMPENCLSDPFSQFSDSSTIVDGTESQFTYLWNFGDPNANGANPNTSTLKNPQHKYTVATTYNVSLTVTSNNGCSTSITQQFLVNGAIPQSSFTVQGGPQYCSDDDVIITNNSFVDVGNIIKLEIYWDYTNDPTNKITDNTPSPGGSYTFRYPEFFSPATRTYTIRVVAYSGDNCLNSSIQTITVKARPELRFDPMASVCSDVPPFQITQAGIQNGLAGNGTFSGAGVNANGLFNPVTAGEGLHTIRYTFTASNGCSKFIEQTIEVFEVPTANAGPDRVVLEGGFVTLVGSGTGPNLSYLWTPARGLNNPAIAKPSSSPDADITYTLVVTTSDGCTATDQVFVKLLKAPVIPNTFSPNRDGIHDKWEINYLESYPGATVQIFNRYGQIIFDSKGYSKPWDGTFKGKDSPAGTYYYIIDPKNGRKQLTGFVDIIR